MFAEHPSVPSPIPYAQSVLMTSGALPKSGEPNELNSWARKMMALEARSFYELKLTQSQENSVGELSLFISPAAGGRGI